MGALPPNVEHERRFDAGTRKLFERLDAHEKKSEDRWELYTDAMEARLKQFVTFQVLLGSIITVASGILIGILSLNSTTRGQVDSAKVEMNVRIEKVDASLQALKAETGTKVEGIYRFLLEKQRPDIVRAQVEEQRRELSPPPTPINPIAPPRRR